MDSIKLVLVNYAVCALLGSIFEFILPRKNKDVFRIVSSVILISVIVIPLSRLDLKSEFSHLDFSLTESDTQQSINHTANLIEKEIYKSIEEILINEGVNEYEIYIDTKVDEATNEIVLQEVTVLVDELFKEKISVLESILKTEFGEVLKIGVKEND
ncbi:MAG: hypothetical protein E7522_08605 [Ruminococcaceae bacterium]|jgi:uncharacterized membrane protein YeiB|nr:hypothetical protein [Oscillospiraceae bacterium]